MGWKKAVVTGLTGLYFLINSYSPLTAQTKENFSFNEKEKSLIDITLDKRVDEIFNSQMEQRKNNYYLGAIYLGFLSGTVFYLSSQYGKEISLNLGGTGLTFEGFGYVIGGIVGFFALDYLKNAVFFNLTEDSIKKQKEEIKKRLEEEYKQRITNELK